MTLHKNRVDAALAMIAEKQLNPTDVERICGVNRTQIYRWKAGEVKQMRYDSFTKLAEALNYTIEYKEEQISITPQINTELGDSEMNELLRTQGKLIEALERENQLLEKINTKSNIPKSVYGEDAAEIVFKFNVQLTWSIKNPGIKVQYNDDTDKYVPIMAAKLGYTELEMADLLQIGEMVEYKTHNIHKLRTAEQREEMLGIIYNFMSAFKKVKMNTTLLIAEIPVKYTHKNGTVYAANVEYRVNWIKGSGTAHIRWLND